jgi:hypothetical protein
VLICTGHRPLLLSTGVHRASLHPVSPLLRRVEPPSTFPLLHLLRRIRASKIERHCLLNVPSDILSMPWCRSSPEGGRIAVATTFPPPFHGENRHHSALLRFGAALTIASLLRCCRTFPEPRSTTGAPLLPWSAVVPTKCTPWFTSIIEPYSGGFATVYHLPY